MPVYFAGRGMSFIVTTADDIFPFRVIWHIFLLMIVHVVAISPVHTRKLIENSDQFILDFDDAYQLTVSMTAGLTLVSYDSDFDTVPNGRVTPEDLLILLQ